ncbi:helix-turn-helix transcriptional regulator [Nocardia mexicana]|uniref:helix-turn-helix transcriptional regulator n=1 Tax=Nocardia mexicana TaxID=279262 RepID=UPI000832C6D7|nr:LuxR C-terminal-related transcriptional regulator [Nocardia mexicana]
MRSTLDVVVDLAGIDAAVVYEIVDRLTAAGFLEDSRFRCAHAADAILRGTAPELRRGLHRRAAHILYERGASPADIAEHLVAAGEPQEPWARTVLRRAADDALSVDEFDTAVRYLEVAYRSSADAGERAETSAQLVSVEWHSNPSTATRNFARLKAAAAAGSLPIPARPVAARCLLWHGHREQVRSALDVVGPVAVTDGTTADELAFLRSWIGYTYPEAAADCPAPQRHTVSAPDSAHALATRLLAAFPADSTGEATATTAYRILARHRLDASTVGPLRVALEGLIYAGRLVLAAAWCDALLAEATARRAPTWQSEFAALRAEISLRQGRLTEAVGSADLALNCIPAANLGAGAALPVAAHVRALTAAGRYEQAHLQLDRQLPAELADSRMTLPYLHARGHLRLVTAGPDRALADFHRCGELMLRWRLDIPGLVPWRNDLAEAHLARGDHGRTRGYAEAHLRRLGTAQRHASGGVSLRLIAATRDPRDRIPPLQEAAAIARRNDNELELAATLAELATAYEMIGRQARAHAVRHAALTLADKCGAEPLRRRCARDPQRVAGTGDPGGPSAKDAGAQHDSASVGAELSTAEYRVAELAAQGVSNREIARTLGVTVSTVEQHLTHTYRKLRVRRRTELRYVLARHPGTGDTGRGTAHRTRETATPPAVLGAYLR